MPGVPVKSREFHFPGAGRRKYYSGLGCNAILISRSF